MEAKHFRPFMFEMVFTLTLSLAKKRIIFYKLIPSIILKALLHCYLGPSIAVRPESCYSDSWSLEVISSFWKLVGYFLLFLSVPRNHEVSWCGLCSPIILGDQYILFLWKNIPACLEENILNYLPVWILDFLNQCPGFIFSIIFSIMYFYSIRGDFIIF